MEATQSLYVYIGHDGLDNATGTGAGYNGGAMSGGVGWSGGGGGATSISLVYGEWNNPSVLSQRIMVAAGGGGAGCNGDGGAAGGLTGFDGTGGMGGTQTGSSNFGGFGYGGCVGMDSDGGGGGGGFYGGGAGEGDHGGGGGSSFINGAPGCALRVPGFTFVDNSTLIIDGKSLMPTPQSVLTGHTGETELGHEGACYAFIRLETIDVP